MSRVDPHSYFDDAQPRSKAWRLKLDLDFDRRIIKGEIEISLIAPGAGPLDLDTKGLTILGASVPYELGAQEPILGRRLRLTLPEKTGSVTIRYETSPEAEGLQWLSPEQTSSRRRPFLFSQCQPIHARSVAPCQDSAAARVSYEAAIVVPEGLTAVMSAGPAGDASAGPGRRAFRFSMPQPIPSYLLALAAGELSSRDLSPRSRVWAEPEVVDKAAWEFAGVEEMLARAESMFGPYPWDRYDMLVLPPSFPYGGMENPRMTFLTPTILAGDRSLVDVVAHELAHSWTGNLVTNATAEHFWLNEGWTVWAERRIIGALRGERAESLAWAIGQKDLDDALERFKDKPELTRLRTRLTGVDPDDAYSVVPYEKGARFLVVLERAAGKEPFELFVKEYMRRYRFSSITTEEFCAFVESSFPGLLARVGAREWLDGAGLSASAPCFVSERLRALSELAAGWREGRRPDAAQASRWSAAELLVYLQALPDGLDAADCASLEALLGLDGRGNCEVLCLWLCLSAAAGREEAFPQARALLSSVGRVKFVRPLYQALGRTPKGRAVAREIFAEAAPAYHALTRRAARAVIEKYPDEPSARRASPARS